MFVQRLVQTNNTETSKVRITIPLWRESTDGGRIPPTRGQQRKIRFLLMALLCSQSPFLQEVWWPNKLCCNLNSKPRNRVFGAHNWNKHKSTHNTHVKQEWWETNGKCLRKWLNLRPELWSIWGSKRPGKWASVTNIQHTSKSSSNWRVHEGWCETSEKILRKWPKTGIFIYLRAQSGQKMGPLRPTHWKVLAMST